MQNELEVFFDYACPYCMRAHGILTGLLPAFPQIRVCWRPCESHPRPERYGKHSDLIIRGMFYAKEQGVDLAVYHEHMYRAVFQTDTDVEDIGALAACVSSFMDAEAFRRALSTGAYEKELKDANALAYDKSGVWVVPAYRLNGKKLDPIEDVGVDEKMLRGFLERAVI